MSKRRTTLPRPFEVTPAMVSWAEDRFPQVDWQAETEEFVDYWLGTGKRMMDWEATWRNWIRRSLKFRRQVVKSPTNAWATVGLDPQYGSVAEYLADRPSGSANPACQTAQIKLF